MWEVVADPSTHLEWRPALLEFQPLGDSPLAVGSRIRERLRWGRRELVLDDVVTAIEPPERLSLEGSWDGGVFEMEMRVAASGPDRSDVTMDWSLTPRSRLVRWALPLLRRSLRHATDEELELLERYVVARGASSAWETPHSAPPR